MADEEGEGSVYEDSREVLVDDDEISPEEEGFMMGYDEAEEKEEETDKDKEEKGKDEPEEELEEEF